MEASSYTDSSELLHLSILKPGGFAGFDICQERVGVHSTNGMTSTFHVIS